MTVTGDRKDTNEAAVAGSAESGRFLYFAAAIWIVALGLRLLYIWEIHEHPVFTLLFSDALGYDLWARRIAEGNWMGDSVFYQAPLYPYFMGVIYYLAGTSSLLVRLVQAVMGAASCVFLAGAGRNFLSARAGILAGFLLAFYPTAIFSDGLIQKSSLALFLMTLFLFLLSRAAGRSSAWWWLGTGLVLALLVLTRENSIILVLIPILWLIFSLRTISWKGAGLRAAFLAAGLAAVLVPVGLRNMAVGGDFLLTTSQFGTNFYIGNNPEADGTYKPLIPGRDDPMYERRDAADLAEQYAGRSLTPGEVSGFWTGKAIDYIFAGPGSWLRLMARKALLVINRVELCDAYDQYSLGDWSLVLGLLNPVLNFGVLVPLAAVGLVVTWPSRRRIWVLYGIMIIYWASVAAFYVFARYRFPLVPVLLLFAASALWSIPGLVKNDGAGILVTACLAGILAAVLSNWPLVTGKITAGRATMRNNIAAQLMDRKREYQEAIWYLEEAVKLVPAYPDAYRNLAISLKMTGRDEEAVSSLGTSLRLEPDSPEANFMMGNYLTDMDRLDKAVSYYRKAVDLDPRMGWAYYKLGQALVKLGRPDEARQYFKRAAELNPMFAGQ